MNTKLRLYENICVFCGASDLVDEKFKVIAGHVAAQLGQNNCNVIYGGAKHGLMHIVAQTAKAHGSKVIGVFPTELQDREEPHQGLDELKIVPTMAARKEELIALADAFLILPGGIGTLDEFFEVLTLKYLEVSCMNKKPIVILNVDGHWDHLIALLKVIVQERFAGEYMHNLYDVVDNVEQLIEKLKR